MGRERLQRLLRLLLPLLVLWWDLTPRQQASALQAECCDPKRVEFS
jgi:hypothetical protein